MTYENDTYFLRSAAGARVDVTYDSDNMVVVKIEGVGGPPRTTVVSLTELRKAVENAERIKREKGK